MKPRVLIVEDNSIILDDITLTLRKISPDHKARYCIDDFLITQARTASEAKEILTAAVDSASPFDILILDLGLPQNENGIDHGPGNGLDVMRMAKAQTAAKEIIIYSMWSDYEHIATAFRGGAVDFINKMETEERLQSGVLSSWFHLLNKENARILNDRIKDLTPYVERGLAHQFSSCLSRFLKSIVHEIEGLEVDVSERLGLNLFSASQDPLVRHFTLMEQAVKNAKREWLEIQANTADPNSDEPARILVGDLLEEIEAELLPCLTIKQVELRRSQDEDTRVLTFGHDVRTVLKEIIFGMLSELPNRGDLPVTIEISVSAREDCAEVRFTDNMLPVSIELADSINRGFSIIPGRHFGREWGLSVAQHVALRGGGRLIVDSLEQGNTIIYLIPLAH
jgi:DNA-binding NarL/FixJ family response regulator